MHILATTEDLLQRLLARDVRQQPQFDLGVVGGHEQVSGLGDEAGADLASQRRADRDVLEVGIVRRQPPGRGRGLVEGRVQAAVGPEQPGQRVQIRLGQLGQLAPALDLRDHRVLLANGLKHASVGRIAGLSSALPRQAQLAEQDLLQLLRGADHELLTGQLEDLPFERVGLGLDPVRDLLDALRIELGPRLLHGAQDPDQRQLDLVQEVRQPPGSDLLPLPAGERLQEQRVGGGGILDVRRQSALLAQLAERIGPAGRFEQVRPDLGVVCQHLRHLTQ